MSFVVPVISHTIISIEDMNPALTVPAVFSRSV